MIQTLVPDKKVRNGHWCLFRQVHAVSVYQVSLPLRQCLRRKEVIPSLADGERAMCTSP